MKKTLALLPILLALCVLCISCREKQVKILPARDLTFCDFVLGGSFDDCYENAQKSQKYNNLSKRKDGLLDYASFTSIDIPNYLSPDDTISVLMGEVEGYQGKIHSIRFETVWADEVLGMYEAKYGKIEPQKHEYDFNDYHIVSLTRIWLFENGRISLIEERREPLHYTLHKQHDLSVSYYDDSSREVVDAYKNALKAKKDSLRAIEEERRRLDKERLEQEDARIKEEKQKSIIESFRF